MNYTKIFLCCLMLCVLGIAGCTSNTSTSSGFGQGGGYTINLTATQTILPQGGQTTLIATVRDAQGNPVNDSTKGVSFTSTWGATITPAASSNTINLGNCSATYTAPTGTTTTTTTTRVAATLPSSLVDQITASYQGAYAYISINVYAP